MWKTRASRQLDDVADALTQLGIELGASLSALHGKVDTLMSTEQDRTEQDLQADLDTIKTEVAAVAAKLTAQAQTIADLQAQIAYICWLHELAVVTPVQSLTA